MRFILNKRYDSLRPQNQGESRLHHSVIWFDYFKSLLISVTTTSGDNTAHRCISSGSILRRGMTRHDRADTTQGNSSSLSLTSGGMTSFSENLWVKTINTKLTGKLIHRLGWAERDISNILFKNERTQLSGRSLTPTDFE